MKYTINSTVDYSSSDGTLFSLENTIDTISLNRMCNEILLLFVTHCGTPLSRDFILNEIWEKRGLSASSNNLNNYVSMLRKALAQCGCSDIITTIPKHGFVFNATVVSLGPATPSTYLTLAPENTHPQPISEVRKTASPGGRFHSTRKFRLSALVLVLLGLVISPFIAEKIRLNELRSEVLRLHQCRFYVIDDLTRRLEKKWVVKRINAILTDNKIDCSLQANVYYSADKKRNVAGEFVLHDLLSYCAYDSKAPCENYIYTRSEGAYENKN